MVRVVGLGSRVSGLQPTARHGSQIPGPQKVCKTIAFMAVITGLGLLFYILFGFRYTFIFLVGQNRRPFVGL